MTDVGCVERSTRVHCVSELDIRLPFLRDGREAKASSRVRVEYHRDKLDFNPRSVASESARTRTGA